MSPWLRYEVEVASDLSSLHTSLCFEGPIPSRLHSGAQGGLASLREVERVDRQGRRAPLRRIDAGNALDTSALSSGDCVAYDVPLRATYPVPETGSARAIDSGLYLLRPPQQAWLPGDQGEIHFEVPDGLTVSVPFPALPAASTYHVPRSAFQFLSRTAVGHLHREQLSLPSCTLTIDRLGHLSQMQLDAITENLSAAVDQVSRVVGRFPSPRLQVLLLPVGPGYGVPIRFGQVTRGGGAGVVLLVSQDATAAALRSDWTAFHEFSHLLVPFVERGDAWLSEGLATYYQEVLRVRAGLRTEAQALERLYERAQRCRKRLREPLERESQQMHVHASYTTVYWAGAAFALKLDVALRTTSDGSQSLDSALATMQRQRPMDAPPLSARDLLHALDRATGTTLPTQLGRRFADALPLPDLSTTWQVLGVAPEGSGLKLDPDKRALRDAIFAEPARNGTGD